MEINIENLVKTYGSQRAVDNISFKIKSGEILGFLGPNGAGKSTTMRIISCFMSPTSGDVKVDGNSILINPIAFKKRIGYLPENNPLYPDMFIYDYLKYMAELQDVTKSQLDKRIKEVINFTGLDQEKHKRISELSKGYKQRVGLAQALIHDPEVLILDEPTSGLDPNQIIEIRDLIRNLGKEKTILLSTHILQEAEATCKRVIIINRGKIVADSPTAELHQYFNKNSILNIQIESGLKSSEVIEFLKKIPEVLDCTTLDEGKLRFELTVNNAINCKKMLFDLCVKKSWYLLELKENETRLEDVFKKLTTDN